MKEKTLKEIGTMAGKGELILTNKKVKLRKPHLITYPDETDEIPLQKITRVEVREMDISASFVFNWMGVEMGLLLIFFGLTSASLPLYHVYRIITGSLGSNIFIYLGKLILSLLMIWLGIMFIPWFDAVIIRIKSEDDKTIRYMKNIRFRNQIEEFKQELVKQVQKTRKKAEK